MDGYKTYMRTLLRFVLLIFLTNLSAPAFAECGDGKFQSSLNGSCLSAYAGEDPNAFDKPMSFVMRQISIRAENTWIAAEGIITDDTLRRFREFLENTLVYKENRIEFNSPGGNLYAAFELGRIIRSLGNETTVGKTLLLANPDYSMDVIERVGAVCFSACAYAFLGGEKRFFSDAVSFGVHRFGSSSFDIPGDLAQSVSSDIARYLEEMGVDQRLFQSASRAAFEDDIYIIGVPLAQEFQVIFDPSIRSSRFEISLLGENIVANSTIYHKGSEYNARLHCIDGYPRFVVWNKAELFPQIFHDLPAGIALFSSGQSEFYARVEARLLSNGNAFATFDGIELTKYLLRNGEIRMKKIWPRDFFEKIKWSDMSDWFNFRFDIENAAGTIPIILREC